MLHLAKLGHHQEKGLSLYGVKLLCWAVDLWQGIERYRTAQHQSCPRCLVPRMPPLGNVKEADLGLLLGEKHFMPMNGQSKKVSRRST